MAQLLKKMCLSRHLRTVCLIIAFVVIGLAVVWARAFFGSKQAYEQGQAHETKGQLVDAIAFFDRSIRWYAPLNPYTCLSAQRLWDIAQQTEQRGDISTCLMALRTLRRGFNGTRHLWPSGTEWILRCSTRIEELVRSGRVAPALPVQGTASSDKPSHLSGRQARHPSTLWSLVVVVGFLGWIGSFIGFIMFAFKGDRTPRLGTSQALLWSCATLAFFALWILGMFKA